MSTKFKAVILVLSAAVLLFMVIGDMDGVRASSNDGAYRQLQVYSEVLSRVRSEYVEEPSQLAALEDHLKDFDVLVTYNGKTYDQPLLETRYRMCRAKPPFTRLAHVDLLFGARRIWKLRLESCRLMELERQILGFHREGDLPGEGGGIVR